MTHLLEFPASHLAGSKGMSHVARYYRQCEKSLFFARKPCEYCIITALKTSGKCYIFPVFFEILRNILQINVLDLLRYTKAIGCIINAARHNLLTCKILTQEIGKNKGNVQKMMQKLTCFSL